MKYITVTQLSERWNITPRSIQFLCRKGRLPGAVRMGKFWIIPEDTERPSDRRYKDIDEIENQPAPPNEICRSVLGAAYHVVGTENELIKSLSDNPEAACLTKAQFAYLHGDIDCCADYSFKLFDSDDFEIKIGAAFLTGICAMYNGDIDGWKRTRMQIENIPCVNAAYKARKELWLAVFGASIYDMSGYPQWFRRGCFESLPSGYYPAAYVHYIKYIYICGDAMIKNKLPDGNDFNSQLFLLPAICEPLISATSLNKAIVSEIYLRLICASSYHHSGRDAIAAAHIDRAIALALPDRVYAPFAEQRLNLDSLIDDRLKIACPDALTKVRALNAKLINGWSAIHNTILNRSHSTELTAKELEAARLAAFGLSNDEISVRMGISINSVKAYLQSAKNKTGVKKRSELARFV